VITHACNAEIIILEDRSKVFNVQISNQMGGVLHLVEVNCIDESDAESLLRILHRANYTQTETVVIDYND
jgi:hypothetical protein